MVDYNLIKTVIFHYKIPLLLTIYLKNSFLLLLHILEFISLNKNVKKFPSESLKNYKAGDVVVSKNDGNKYKVVMYKNQKRWKLIEE